MKTGIFFYHQKGERLKGKLIAMLRGETRRDLAPYLIPRMISVLVEVSK